MNEPDLSGVTIPELDILGKNAAMKANSLRGGASKDDLNFMEYNYWQDTVRNAINNELCKRTKELIP